MQTLLRDFNEKLGRENIFKPTTENESLRQDIMTIVSEYQISPRKESLVFKSTLFLQRNIHK
jgi:hypothetical protein